MADAKVLDASQGRSAESVATSASNAPGPWAVFDEFTAVPLVKTEVGGHLIALPYDGINSGDPNENLSITRANARLIAAAPDLLEALKELNRENIAAANRAGSKWPNSAVAQALYDKVQAALAKAEGK